MAIVNLVLECPFGANKEGDVISCDSETAEKFKEAGIARDATVDDMNGNEEEEKEEGEEVAEEQSSEDEGDEEKLHNLSQSVKDTVTKATEKAIEKLTAQKRPSFNVPANRHVSGSDYGKTGGFKNIGDAVQSYLGKKGGDYEAAKKFKRWEQHVTTKGYMSISGSSGHAGGDLVPQQWAEDLFRLSFADVPNLAGMCTKYPMQNQTLNLPAWVQSAAAAGVQASVTAEGQTITATQGVTANVPLTLVKGTILVNITDELLRFNSYALTSVINDVAPERMRFLINDGVVNGTNSQLNLANNASALTQIAEVANHISYNDVLGMYSKLYDGFPNSAVWLINQSTVPELYGIGYPNRAATTQFPAFVPGGFDGILGPKPEGKLLGMPVYRVENVPGLGNHAALILWHPGSCALGEAGPVADYTNALYFNLAQDTFRFLYYFGTVNRMNTTYTRADGSKASNIVVLSAGSTSSS